MTPDLQKYYETYFDLFATAGWKQFIEELEKSSENLSIEQADTLEHLYHFKGQLYVINNALRFEELIRNAYDNILESEKIEEDD